MTKDFKYSPSPGYRFLLYCPNNGLTFWKTAEERNEAGKELISEYLDDGEWSEEVVDIFAGTVDRHIVEVDQKHRAGKLDDDGYDEDGQYWPNNECDYTCNYELQPLPITTKEPQP